MLELDKIHCGDNCDLLGQLPRECIDLVVTSPPYDDLRTYAGHSWDFFGVAWQLKRVLKHGGVIVWVVSDATKDGSETGSSMEQALHFKRLGLNLHDTMIYMKDNPPPVGGQLRYYQAWEYMFVFTKGTPSVFNPIVEPRRNKWNDKRTTRIRPVTRNKAGVFTEKQVDISENVKIQNVFNYVVSGGSVASDEFAHKHPAIYPEALVRDAVISWSSPGDIVLDPFVGSGTTAKIAKALGRRFLGLEINQEYCEIAERRIDHLALELEAV